MRVSSYQLSLHPDLLGETGTFTGSVAIFLTAEQPRRNFYVHAKFLDITSWEVSFVLKQLFFWLHVYNAIYK